MSVDSEAFTLVTSSSHRKIYDDYEELSSARYADLDTSLQRALRQQYLELSLTVTLASNVSLLQFAAGGNATADLDIKDEAVKRLRYFFAGDSHRGTPDRLVEGRTFAKYLYKWGNEYFIVYIVQIGFNVLQYILKEPGEGETTMSGNDITDQLITTVGLWQKPTDYNYIYVYDGYWSLSRALYKEIEKANWDDVILNEDMKETLTDLMHKFFDSEDIYKDLGVPWKRGVIFYGPAGNGKTISIKALMHSLFEKYGYNVPSLYVKSAPQTWDIRSIFVQARIMAPCLLIFEDIDTIVTPSSRSYFFNEVDGLENNDGLFMVASTNHIDQLDPGLSNRPSRFDRKYLFPLPSEAERVLYCEYWREKLKSKPAIKYPKKLSPAIASITKDFSFAYLKEAFVATLLVIAGNRSEESIRGGGDDEGGDLDDYELWREMKKQVKLLRDDMDTRAIDENFSPFRNIKPDMSWKEMDEPRKADAPFAIAGQPIQSSPVSGQGQPQNVAGTGAVAGKAPKSGFRLDCDFQHAPLMTDDGMFIDSRFDGPRVTGLLD